MKYCGDVIRYQDNVDTDVIIPARYLNTSDTKELASHCMEDLDKEFKNKVKPNDIIEKSDFVCSPRGGITGGCRLRLKERLCGHKV